MLTGLLFCLGYPRGDFILKLAYHISARLKSQNDPVPCPEQAGATDATGGSEQRPGAMATVNAKGNAQDRD